MVSDITFLRFLLFSMCQSLHVAVIKISHYITGNNILLENQKLQHWQL